MIFANDGIIYTIIQYLYKNDICINISEYEFINNLDDMNNMNNILL